MYIIIFSIYVNNKWQQTFHILKSYLICIFSLTHKLNVGMRKYNSCSLLCIQVTFKCSKIYLSFQLVNNASKFSFLETVLQLTT